MLSIRKAVAAILLAVPVNAREITFPPVAAIDARGGQVPLFGQGAPIDISGSAYQGLTTFANLPYVHCLSAEKNVDSFDIAFLGAPFDTGVTARPGARFGPTGIRWGSRRLDKDMGDSIYTGQNPLADWAKVVDCGDAPLTFLDNTIALKQLDKAHEVISSRTTNSSDYTVPRIITLGGDHTTTLSALRSTFHHWGPVSVLHFDSHIDTWDPAVLGGGISHYAGVNHGTFLHLAHEEGLIRNTSSHAGIRAPVKYSSDVKNDKRCGFDIVTARDMDKLGVTGVIEKLKAHVKGTRVYVSVDIDVLDPAFAPATGTAEPGGWSTRELLTVLDGLEGIEIVGGDVGWFLLFARSTCSS
ncbi:hypothetical protein FH972_025028 [Carpinus fangiana]|uniref:Arginase n=1 Tax=Carpinus fangiana TaxID=176857 RepID=A0A5N6KZU6_9ROSI|nr:hypothetical protein FH972_025028 [Carpinus fangiana]